jgi:hypothetical protein
MVRNNQRIRIGEHFLSLAVHHHQDLWDRANFAAAINEIARRLAELDEEVTGGCGLLKFAARRRTMLP